ncbi:polysaccharide deacetylase family protein [Alteribacter natronophilus]|uniref:polysaccharide deacetylase family protein n=1 Tax=Alteribacter natronophilus TaxID=2583810 RepID=UPI00110E2AB0|nr:polysaccharide deacetylase family protein [Alteribacter natronophilus]TMW71460.1 DUF3298 domain-containing protein [Alteribacter natronophilus]
MKRFTGFCTGVTGAIFLAACAGGTEETTVTENIQQSSYDDINIITENGKGDAYRYSLVYPSVQGLDAGEKVEDEGCSLLNAFIEEAEQAHEEDDAPFTFQSSLEVDAPFDREYISFLTEYEYKVDEAVHRQTSVSFEAETGNRVTLSDVFNEEVDYLGELADLMETKMTAMFGDAVYEDHVKELTQAEPENYESFMLTDHGLIFAYNRGEWTREYFGAPVVLLPYEDLASVLDSDFAETAGVEIPEEMGESAAENGSFPEEPPAELEENGQEAENGNREEDNDGEEGNGHGSENGEDGNGSGENGNGDAAENGDDTGSSGGTSTTSETLGIGNAPASDGAPRVALTFDDGPDPDLTPVLLDHLDDFGARATFYVIGSYTQSYPHIVEETFSRGHEIGNHTWSHPDLTTLGEEEIEHELTSTSDVIEQVTGERPVTFRPPYGAISGRVHTMTDKPEVRWTVDSRDWQAGSTQEIVDRVLPHVHDGAVILLHDIHPRSIDAARIILEELSAQGYEFVTISELYSLN